MRRRDRVFDAVIFLDVDGVLHPLGENFLPLHANLEDLVARTDEELSSTQTEIPTRVVEGEFMSECMAELKYIVDTHNVGIVLSTTWRETVAGREAVKQQLEQYGIPASTVIGCTPMLNHDSPSGCKRTAEIEQWIEENNVQRYVAIDDFALKLNPDKFVHIDKSKGLTHADALRAIELISS